MELLKVNDTKEEINIKKINENIKNTLNKNQFKHTLSLRV